MKVFVTGTDGYIGSRLGPMLVEQGHEVIGCDTGFYRQGWLYHLPGYFPTTRVKDIRSLTESDLEGVDAVVHMAELSNDPLGQLAPDITFEINHKGSVHLARLAKATGVPRFVYTSSCSVYGVASDHDMTETSPLNPQTAYAQCKALVERDLQAMADETFSPTFLRNATLYGPSPRMRFDIVLNNLSGLAWVEKEIRMISDGTPWRPLVHIEDACQAILRVLEAPRDTVHNQIFNVGDSRHNYQVKTIADIVADTFPGCRISLGDQGADNRSYRVSFDKIQSVLPSFQCRWTAEAGARELYQLFQQIGLSRETFYSSAYTRLKQLEYLVQTRQLDERFFWSTPG